MSGPLKIVIKGVFVMAVVLMWPLMTMAEERRCIAGLESQAVCLESDGSLDKEDMPKPSLLDRYSIEEAVFHITVSRENARGKMRLSGRVLTGKPRRIPIAGDDIVITDIQEVTGGALLCDAQTGPCVFLVPDESRSFRVTLTFMLKSREDTRSKFISLGIAPALKNILILDHATDIMIEVPAGEVDRQGMFHVSGGRELVVRFNERTSL